MQAVQIGLSEELAALLNASLGSLDAAEELIVLELYRRGTVSGGKAAELLRMPLVAFIEHASAVGIPHFDLTDDEWAAERRIIDKL